MRKIVEKLILMFVVMISLNVLFLSNCNADNMQEIGELESLISTLQMQGETKQMIEKCYELLEYDIEDKGFRYIAGQTIINVTAFLINEKRMEEAIALSLEVTKKIPEYGPGYRILGLIYYEIGNYELAKQYFEKALEKTKSSFLQSEINEQEIENLIKMIDDKIYVSGGRL